MKTEQQQLTEDLVNVFCQEGDGFNKEASSLSTGVLRRKIREDGFQRKILPFDSVDKAQLTELPDTELPVIIKHMEPDSPGAKSVPYNSGLETVPYYANKYVIQFHLIKTKEFVKNRHELWTNKTDLQGMVMDNALRDIHTAEDSKFIGTVDDIVGAEADFSNPGTSQNAQNVLMDGQAITRSGLNNANNFMRTRRINIGVALVNNKTAGDISVWDRNEIGGDMAQDTFKQGLKGIKDSVIGGISHIFTIKDELVPNGVFYQFGERGYLGDACQLEDIKLHVENKHDLVRWYAQEHIGLTIGNTDAVQRIRFELRR